MHTSYADEDARADAPIGYSETQYIKLYDSVLDDREIQRLPATHFRFLINCWLLARRSGPCLGTPYDIAFKLRIPDEDAVEFCAALSGYLTQRADGKLDVRNWSYWQASMKSTDRVRKSRAKKKAEAATNETNETSETNETFHGFNETISENHETDETLEKKRKEKNRKEDVAAVAATRAVPPPPAKKQQQPDFFPFDDEPDVQRLVSDAVEEVATHWPMLGNVPNAKRVWERHAVSDPQGPEAWCRKIRQTALVHQAAHERCKRSNARHFIPTLEKWVQDGDYARKPPTAMEGGHMRLIDMFPEVPNAS